MFSFVQTSSMQQDVVYWHFRTQVKARFRYLYRKSQELCGQEDVPWLTVLDDTEALWRDIGHPLFVYWLEQCLAPAVERQDRDETRAQLRELGRLVLMPLLRQGTVPRRIEALLDDRGELKFPGARRWLSLGADHAGELAVLEPDAEGLSVTVSGTRHQWSWSEVTGRGADVPALWRERVRIGESAIEWDSSDPLVRQFLQGEMEQVLVRNNHPEPSALPPHEQWSDADRAYYERALGTIREHWPEMYEEMAAHIRMIVLLDSDKVGGMTFSLFQGAIFLSHRPQDMGWTVENLIHEFGHARLDPLFAIDPLLLNDSSEQYPSPWREDARHLKGVLHGTFVFTRVAQWYHRLSRNTGSQEAAERLQEVLGQVGQGIEILRANGQFTELGQALVQELADQHAELCVLNK